MRFRPTDRNWQMVMGVFFILDGLLEIALPRHGQPHWYRTALLAGMIFVGITSLVGYWTMYWELRPHGVYERRLWRKRCVEYSSITGVYRRKFQLDSDNWWRIEYRVPGSCKVMRLYVNPQTRREFFYQLQSHAPQADYSNLDLLPPSASPSLL